MSYVNICRLFLAVFTYVCFPLGVNAWSINSTLDSCYIERGGLLPCSSTLTGNLMLMVCYGALLGAAAKFISDGAEMLLDFGLPPSLIGGIVLPVLGAIPDAAIIVASGMGADAQEKLAVGMGTLAGSTVMLLTVAWSASLGVGRCDLDSDGEAMDTTCERRIRFNKQGVTVFPDVRSGITLMLVTSLSYFLVQSADWYWGATLTGVQPAYVRNTALATLVVCMVGLIINVALSIFDARKNERLVKLRREELLKRKVLRAFIMSLTRNDLNNIDSHDATEGPRKARKFFNAWNVTTGSKNIKEKMGLLDDEAEEVALDCVDTKPEPKAEENKRKLLMKCICFLGGGVAMVTIFADPMCDVLSALTSTKNKSFIPIPLFYISFVVTPFCSNASELVSSLIFASKKTRESITMTYSQLFGAATMNNTLCLGIFMALVYFKDLEWVFGAEVVCILTAQWIVGLLSYMKTYRVWMGIVVGAVYILCILVAWLLENKAGWH